jgi:hypothetical protein
MNLTLETVRAWISTGALIGLFTLASRLWIQNRRLSMQAKVEDRQGYGTLITTLTSEVERLANRVETLEESEAKNHRLILELLGQLNRSQAVAIMGSQNLTPELRSAMESTLFMGRG